MDPRRRLIISFALAIALVEVVAALIPGRELLRNVSSEPERITIAREVRIEHRPTPSPKPTPTPKPPVQPKVIAPRHVVITTVHPAAEGAKSPHHRVASARPLVHTRFHSAPARIHIPMGGQGSGSSRTAKALSGGGTGTSGSGTGAGGTGTGSGGESSDEPCGFVEFVATDMGKGDGSGGMYERVQMNVHFPDKHSESVVLDYPWHYTSLATDPWSDQNLHNPAFDNGIPFQSPPVDQIATESPLVLYVMKHTGPGGVTKLKDCPGA